MGGGLVPSTLSETLGFTATAISAVNITGGFLVEGLVGGGAKSPNHPHPNIQIIPTSESARARPTRQPAARELLLDY